MKRYTTSIFLLLLIKVLRRPSLISSKTYNKRKKNKNHTTFLSFLSQHTNYGSSKLSTSWIQSEHFLVPTQTFITLPITLRRFKMKFTFWTSQGLWKFLDDSIASFLYWKYVPDTCLFLKEEKIKILKCKNKEEQKDINLHITV